MEFRIYSLPRARSTARRLFSRHISGTQSFQENRHVNINLLVVHNPLVPLIGRLVDCSARTRTDRQTDRTTTVTLAAHARRGLITTATTQTAQCYASAAVSDSPGIALSMELLSNGLSYIEYLADNHDVIPISEHWLLPFELHNIAT